VARVLVTGGTGFVGRRLVRALVDRGDAVTVLSRDPDAAARRLPSEARAVAYTPTEDGPWFDEVARADAVVHLAGEPIGGVRWTAARKRAFESSRIDSAAAIVRAMAKAPEASRPKVLVGASAVGFYGSRPASEELDETSPPGSDYLASLCVRWEAAEAKAAEFGVRVVHARLGIVLGEGGGALAEMTRAFRMGAGGPIGSGEQAMSWIHADDAVGLLLLAIDDPRASGPMNVVAPEPVTMRQLAREIGLAMGRSSWLRVPAFAVRAMFGEGADPILGGQRVLPRVAERLGHAFRFRAIAPALRDVLGRGER
jgi:uncharacterized protein (TIGR01777 family)